MSGTTSPATKPMDVGAALGDGHSAEDIANYLAANPARAPLGASGKPYNVAAALSDGHPAAQIIDHLNGIDSTAQGVPIAAPIARGLAQGLSGVANLADDVGFTGIGHSIRGHLGQQNLEAPTSGADLVSNLKAGHYGAALSDLPSAAIEGAPLAATGLIAGTAAAPLGAAAATGAALGSGALLGAATSGDQIARTRAANNGEAAPSASDLAVGLGAGAATGALGTIGDGLGGVAGRIGGLGSIGGVKGVLAKFLGNNATKVAADAAAPQVQSLASTADTNQGAQLTDGAASVASIGTGLATRAGLGLAQGTTNRLDGTTARAQLQQAAKDYSNADPEAQQDLQNQAAAAQLVKSYQTGSDDPLVRSDFSVAARTAKNDLAGQVHSYIGNLSDQGILGDQDLGVIKTALSNATNSQRVLSPTEHLDPIQDLNIPDDVKDNLTQAISQVNLLSNAGVANRGTGPFQTGLGAAGGFLGSKATGGHYSPMGFVGNRIGSGIGGAVGGFIDGKLGLSTPVLARAGSDASDAITAAGQQVPDTMGTIKAASGQSYDIAQTQLAAIQKAAQDQAAAIQMNRQFDKNTAAGQADARSQYQAMLREAYGTNAEADKIEAARQQMVQDMNRRADLQERAADQVSGMAYRAGQAQLGAQQTEAIGMNRQFDQGQAADHTAMLNEAYGMNQQASQIEAAHQQMQAALAARSNTADTAGNWMERQLLSKFKGANPDVPVTGAAVLNARTPDQVFEATGGRFGNPAGDPPQMNGIPAPGQPQPSAQPATGAPQPTPQQAPAPVQQPAMGALPGAPQAPSDPVAVAQARAQAMGLLQGSRQPATAAGALAPQGLQALAQKLPDYVQGLGQDLRTHLVASGQAQPVNDMLEVSKALGQLKDSGVIDQTLHDAIKGHNGRLMEPVYNAIRNQMLLNYGINRTVH